MTQRRLRYRSWKSVHPFLLYATTRKKGKETEGITQSHKRVTIQLYGERTTLDRFLRKLAWLKGPITQSFSPILISKCSGVSDLQGVKISVFPLTDFHDLYLKRRCVTQGCAFLGFRWENKLFRVSNPLKPQKVGVVRQFQANYTLPEWRVVTTVLPLPHKDDLACQSAAKE